MKPGGRKPPQDRIGESFMAKRPPPARHAWIWLGAMLGLLVAIVVLFAVGQWQPGVFGIMALGGLFLWARKSLLP